MKNIRYIIVLLVAVLTFGTTQAENLKIQRTRQSKDPWQVMQTILYNHFENINSDLIVPCSKIGHSVFFLGNSCNTNSDTISFISSSALEVLLEHGQHKWIELDNGMYKVKVTSSSGIKWWLYGKENVIIENGLYSEIWNNYEDILVQDIALSENNKGNEPQKDMIYSITERVIGELSNLSKFNYETFRTLLTHF